MLRFILARGCGMGMGTHRLKAKVRDKVGAIINNIIEVESGRRGSLINSLYCICKWLENAVGSYNIRAFS